MEIWPPTYSYKQRSRKGADSTEAWDIGLVYPLPVAWASFLHLSFLACEMKALGKVGLSIRAFEALTCILCISEVWAHSSSRALGNPGDSQTGLESASSRWASALSDFLSGQPPNSPAEFCPGL